MKKIVFLLFFVFSISQSWAVGFSDSVTVGLPTTAGVQSFVFKLSQPAPAVGVYQATLLFAASQERNNLFHQAFGSEAALAFSTTSKVALVLVRGNSDTSFAQLSSPAVLADSVRAGLTRLGQRSNHPELTNTPLFPAGFAKASRFAIAVASALPNRTAAFASIRAYRVDAFAGASVATIPHLVLTGEVSGPDVRNNAGVFFSNQLRTAVLARRAAGELIEQSVEMNASQSTMKAKSWTYLFTYIAKAMEKRIPAGSNPLAGPVSLTAVSAASGFFGQSQVWNNFKSANYSTGAALPAASSFWLFDQAHAAAWKAFHVTNFDSVAISPLPLPAVPYCSGQRPSAINARFTINPTVQVDPTNFYRMEISDITGNFDHPIFSARYFGTTSSASQLDSIKEAVISDNLNYATKVPTPTVKRYRIRVVSSKPYMESANTGELDINFCGPLGGEPRVYLSNVRPFKQFYNRGDSVSVTIYKNPSANFQYTPGNVVRIELSNKNYDFTAGLTTVMYSGIPPFTAANVLDSFTVKFKLPDTLSFGNRYRLKPFLEGIPASQGRQTSGNGHDITIVPNQSSNQIEINTTAISDIQQTSVKSGGVVLFDGGSPITGKGVVWSTTPAPTTALTTKTSDGTGSGSFISSVTGLSPGQTYYLRAYATNASTTKYGAELSFTTLIPDQVPGLSTDSVISITQTTAISGGNVLIEGGSAITARGVCWGTSPNPIISVGGQNQTGDGVGVGTFISNLSGLTAGTTYYIRSYATNTLGTGYGNQRTFTTVSIAVQAPSVTSNNVTQLAGGLTCDSVRAGGNVTFDGGAAITERGVVWDVNPAPTIALSTKIAVGSGTGGFTAKIGNLLPQTGYYFRAYGTNSAGTGYGDEVAFTTCVSVDDLISSKVDMAVYPNPAGEQLFIQTVKHLKSSNVSVKNLEGKEIKLELLPESNGRIVLKTSNLKPGVYFIKAQFEDGSISTMKFLK
jgi:hypothetical protein